MPPSPPCSFSHRWKMRSGTGFQGGLRAERSCRDTRSEIGDVLDDGVGTSGGLDA